MRTDLKAIVHIGTEKTGTSSIQLFLRKNRRALQAEGYHFLQSAGKTNNWALPAYCAEETRFNDFYRLQEVETGMPLQEFRQDFIGKFEAEIRSLASNIHTVVISSEHFHSRLRTDKEMDNIRQLVSRFFDDIRIICYLREQAETCASWYSTSMKSGSTYSFYEFVRRCRPESYYFNYFDMLCNWERHFGLDSMEVALFDSGSFLNRNLLDDFASRVDPALVGRLSKSIHAVNESLKPMGQALCRALNIAIPASDDDPVANDLRGKCKDIIARRLTGKGQQIDAARQRQIYDSFAESNEKLRQKYFAAQDVLFDPPAEVVEESSGIDGEFLEVVAEMFKVLERESGRPLSSDDYARIWSAINISMRDVIDVPEEVKQGGTELILTEKDARLLRRAAIRAEWADMKSAEKLMKLAYTIYPELPGIRIKLDSYKERLEEEKDGKRKFEFVITVHGEQKFDSPDEFERIDTNYAQWIASLDVPLGNPVASLSATNTRTSAEGTERNRAASLKAYVLFRASSLDEAIAIAEKCPHLEAGGYSTLR